MNWGLFKVIIHTWNSSISALRGVILLEKLISRSLLRNTQKTKHNTEKNKFCFLMGVLFALLAWKISFLTYILHSSFRTRDKISWEKYYSPLFLHSLIKEIVRPISSLGPTRDMPPLVSLSRKCNWRRRPPFTYKGRPGRRCSVRLPFIRGSESKSNFFFSPSAMAEGQCDLC